MIFQPTRLVLVLLAAVALPALAADNNLAIVNGKPIPAALLEPIVKAQTSRGHADTPELRAQLKQELISMELLTQEGSKLGLDKNTEVKNALELARKEIMSRAMAADFAKKNQVKDADIKTEYEKYKADLSKLHEYHAHHILVDKEDSAKDIIAKLKTGAKFEELAKLSKDNANASSGGDLGWTLAVKYPKPFAEALVALQKGKVSDSPVKTQFGYHVIRLDDIRPAKVGTLEEIKPKISIILMQKKFLEFQQELLKKAKIQ